MPRVLNRMTYGGHHLAEKGVNQFLSPVQGSHVGLQSIDITYWSARHPVHLQGPWVLVTGVDRSGVFCSARSKGQPVPFGATVNAEKIEI